MTKICPACGHHNDPAAEFCECEYDLASVPLTDVDAIRPAMPGNGASGGQVPLTDVDAIRPGASPEPHEVKAPGSEPFRSPGTEKVETVAEPLERTPAKETMKDYKECPSCHKHNPPLAMVCECNYDLSSVEVTRGERQGNAAAQRYVRVCQCGEKNLLMASTCARCGADMTLIPPTRLRETMWVLRIRDGQESLQISDGQKYSIGKQASLSNGLQRNGFVSRIHIEVCCISGKLYISHRSRTNPTLVNGSEISWDASAMTELKSGDVICMGNYPEQADTPQAGYLIVERSK